MNSMLSNLLFHLIESSVVAGMMVLTLGILKILDSRTRCWVYRIGILKFLLPTLWLASYFKSPEIGTLAPFVVTAGNSLHDFQQQVDSNQTTNVVLGGLVGTLLLVFAGALVTWFQHRRIFGGIEPFADQEASLLSSLQKEEGVNQDGLRGYAVEEGPTIGLYGIFRPRIIAKRKFLEMLDEKELVSAFRHEITHWKKKDHLWRFFVELVVCCFWFHPLLWFLRRRLILETEKRCDETVLAGGIETQSYANCLLKAAEFSQDLSRFGAIALSETSLKQRVSNVIQYQYRKVNRMKIVTVAALAGVALTGSLFVFGSIPEEKTAKMETRIYEIGDLDQKPVPRVQIPPVYPKELKEAKINGRVVLTLIINEIGDVEKVEIESSTDILFEQPSIDAVKQWKFSNGVVDGKAVKVRVRAPLIFKLENAVNADSLYDLIKKSTNPSDIEFLNNWEPRWKAISALKKDPWDSREEGNAWNAMARVIYDELRDYMVAKESGVVE